MSRKREAIFMGIGVLAGLALSGPAVQAATTITATLSSQPIYVDGQRVSITAYSIGGNNYVKIRDIGKAVDFGVTCDATTNSVYIDPSSPYIEEVAAPLHPLRDHRGNRALRHPGTERDLPPRCRLSSPLLHQKPPPPLHQLRPLRRLGHVVLGRRLRQPAVEAGGQPPVGGHPGRRRDRLSE